MSKTQKTSQTTTPTNPSWVTDSVQGQMANVDKLAANDPQSYVPGASALQQLAFGQAPAALSGTPNSFTQMANTYGQRGTDWQNAFATAANANAPTPMTVANASAVNATMTPDQMARAQQTGQASTYQASTLDPKNVALADTPSLDTGRINTLMGPYLAQVVSALQADQEQQAGETRARLSGHLAQTGAFGGSGADIARSETEGQIMRARNTALSDALQSGYGQALTAAQNELGLQTQTGLANAGAKNQGALANLAALNTAGQFNAGEQNTNARTDATLGTQASTTNAGILGDLARANATNGTQVNLANAGAANDAGRLQYSTLADLAKTNASNQTAVNTHNADTYNQGADRALTAAQLFGQLGQNQDNNTRLNLGLLGDLGTQQHGIDAATAAAPISVAQQLAGITGSLPNNLFHGENTTSKTTTSDPMGALGSLAMLAAMPLTGGLSGLAGLGGLGGLATSALGSVLPASMFGGALGGGLSLAGHTLSDFKGFI